VSPAARAGTTWGRASRWSEEGSAREGSLGGSVWPPQLHICLCSAGSGLSSHGSDGTSGVWRCEAASALPACGTAAFTGPE